MSPDSSPHAPRAQSRGVALHAASSRPSSRNGRASGNTIPNTLPLSEGAPRMTSMAEDTVRMPGPLEVPVVRPALAMLYRLAVGPHADHYAPRFLAFERAGKPLAMWNWPAFLAPPIWAAYRGLWIAAMVFALLPLGGAITFMFVNASIDRAPGLWALFAVLLVWVLPGAIAGSCADYLVYRRVRRIALAAERDSANPVDAATRAAGLHGVSWFGAAAGVAGMAVVALAVSHDLVSGWRDHVVRQQVVTTLAAVRGLEREAETSLTSARLEARQGFVLPSSVARRVVDDVDVSPENGRLRVRFGPSVPELAGKTILLAPTRNARQEVRWLCVPVDIPAAYLPPRCLRR